ncbi:ATP-binding protein [Vibrio sp. 10N.261.55.A7]|uniref:ATP-binding protein n=1 Tax=Vibrio sp. 10N.261.55.A7 TaxID=1880851 RepID=UPI000C82D249|nr:ATP-binding protein [Vibrio sp. 10N.261.55.A7]PMJ90726.1 two-component sensor histidine kinase [Vibrio sp. 10N.261.55.A7]
MIRAFAILWLAVFVPIALLIFPTGVNPVQRLNESFSEHFYKKTYSVNFELLTGELLAIPQEQWASKIKSYKPHFGYPVKLQAIDEYQSEPDVYQSILNGEIEFLYGDPMALVQRVGSSQQLLYFALNESSELTVLNQAKGSLYLAIEDLRRYPKEEWQQRIEAQSEHIPFQIRVKERTDLSSEAKAALTDDPMEPVSFIGPEGSVELLAPISSDVWLHIEDDVSSSTQMKLTSAIVGAFFLVISIALVMWVYPLWRDLKRLVITSNEFGNGILSKRATTSKLSVISQLSESFNHMADNIETLIAGQKELTNSIAHDLRTPLYRLRFALEMMEDETTPESQKQKYRKTAQSSVEDLDHLINQTLLLSRYNRVADINHFSPCCFAEELLTEMDYFKLEHSDLDVRFYCSPELKDKQLFVDNKGLMRAVKNLLTNASRFTQSTISVSFLIEKNQYKITVEDDGVGVPKEHAERIFEPFMQLDNNERSSDKGHGLGLAIVKQIMVWHKGRASVTQSDSNGARFALSWPVNPIKSGVTKKNVTNLDTNRP